MAHIDSYGARSELKVGSDTHEIFRLDALQSSYDVARLPYSLKVLLENLLRREDGQGVTRPGHREPRHLGGHGRALARDRLHARPGC